jgi:hypothetical protein
MSIAPPAAVDDAIAPGETVRWWGAPPTGLLLRASDGVQIPLSMMAGGFAIFWETMVVTMNAPWFFKLWGIPFVAAGLYMVAGRFFVDALLRAQTHYAVTDRAAYVLRGGPFPVVRRFAGSALAAVSLEPRSFGEGTIRFASAPSPFAMFSGNQRFAAPLDAFERIGDVQHVYALVAEAGRTP